MVRFNKGKKAYKRPTLKKPKNPKVFKKLALALVITLVAAFLYITQIHHHTKAYKDEVRLQQTVKQLEHSRTEVEQGKSDEAAKAKQIDELNKQLEDTKKQLEAKRNTPKVYAEAVPKQAPVSYARPAEEDKAFIYQHESGNNPGAVNSIGCAGLGQACPGSKLPCSLTDYACQDTFFTNYMLSRYGSWAKARAFWEANRWW